MEICLASLNFFKIVFCFEGTVIPVRAYFENKNKSQELMYSIKCKHRLEYNKLISLQEVYGTGMH